MVFSLSALSGSGIALGLAGGLRHALEPDHLAALSTLVAEQATLRSTLRYAFLWALGHSAVLALAAAGLHLLRAEVPEHYAHGAELCVGILLILLGVRALWRARRALAVPARTASAMPLGIGMLHGLAGSGAFSAWLAAAAPTSLGAFLMLGSYSAGLCLSMCAAALLARRGMSLLGTGALRKALGLSGVLSLGVGMWWLWVQ